MTASRPPHHELPAPKLDLDLKNQRETLVRAIDKDLQGQKLTQAEFRVFRKWSNYETERRGLIYIRDIPQKDYRQFSGNRKASQLTDQHRLFGIPCIGRKIDAVAVIRWIHDFFSEHRYTLHRDVNSPKNGDSGDPRYKLLLEQVANYQQKNKLLEAQLEERQGALLSRSDVHAMLTRAASILRQASHRLQQLYGSQAANVMDQALVDFQNVISQVEEAEPATNGKP